MKKYFILLFVIIVQAEEFTGLIKPINNLILSSAIEGKLSKIFIEEGSIIKVGDNLLTVDNELQKLEVERRRLIWKDVSQISFAKKNLKIIKSLLSSTRKLYNNTKAVSRDDLNMLEMKYYTAKGDLKAREENEKKEKLEYKIAKTLLSKYIIKSPIDGVVTKIEKDVGEWTNSGERLINIVNTKKCFLDISIDEKYRDSIKKGDMLEFKPLTKDNFTVIDGNITFISPITDSASGLVRIKISFDNSKINITSGVSASVSFDAKKE